MNINVSAMPYLVKVNFDRCTLAISELKKLQDLYSTKYAGQDENNNDYFDSNKANVEEGVVDLEEKLLNTLCEPSKAIKRSKALK